MKKLHLYTTIAIGLGLIVLLAYARHEDTGLQIGPEPSSTEPDASVVESVPAGCTVGNKCSTPNSYCFTSAGDHNSPKLSCAKVGNDLQWQ